jgi:alkylation response protein AidB-like acyl-CoA dehydrogenase
MAGETIQALGGNGYINEYPAAVCGAMPNCTKSVPVPAKSAVC